MVASGEGLIWALCSAISVMSLSAWCFLSVLSSLKQQIFIIPHSFWGSGIRLHLSWVVLAQGLSQVCIQTVWPGCSHLKARLGLDSPLPHPVTWLLADLPAPWQLAGGSVPQHMGVSIVLFTTWQLASPRARGPWEKNTFPVFLLFDFFACFWCSLSNPEIIVLFCMREKIWTLGTFFAERNWFAHPQRHDHCVLYSALEVGVSDPGEPHAALEWSSKPSQSTFRLLPPSDSCPSTFRELWK